MGVALTHIREANVLQFFILVSIFQVCWVLAPISKAILKYIKPENKWSRTVAEEAWFGRHSSSWKGAVLRGSCRAAGLERTGESHPNPQAGGHTAPSPPPPGTFCFFLESEGQSVEKDAGGSQEVCRGEEPVPDLLISPSPPKGPTST